VFCERLVIEGAPDGVCTFSADLVGRQQADASFTAALVAQSVQRFPFNLVKCYFDTSWANLGTTQKTGLVRGFTWTLDTMFRAYQTADGALYYSSVVESPKAPTLALKLKRGSDSDAQRGYHEARTTTFIRIELLGQTEIDSGQGNVPYLIIDGAYRYQTWPDLGDDEGASIEQPTAVGVYDGTGGKMFETALLTDLAAFP
jgi:hypothetical protein